MDSSQTEINSIDSNLSLANRWDHTLARLGYRRMQHRVEPGLYALGKPTPDAPVFASANYTLSFDALRSALAGVDAYILVLDTKGVNVWCAAGEGTFGTDELVQRIHATRLSDIVSHRKLILPQLAGPGVAAHEVKQRAGFQVEYGPVRAADLPEYLKTGGARAEMRRVHFGLGDRLVVVPIEIVHLFPLVLFAALLAYWVSGLVAAALVVGSALAGVVLFPVLLPWLPTRDFSSRGFILGWLVALPFALLSLRAQPSGWERWATAVGQLLVFPPLTAYLALSFTGSTTFTSRTGVRREIFAYIPIMALSLVLGLVVSAIPSVVGLLGR